MPRNGSREERGYGREHRRVKEAWRPVVDAGDAYCHAVLCLWEHDGYSRWIEPGTRWHLGHTPDRTAWTGPEHERCNTSEGATRGNRMRRTPRTRRWIL